MDHVEFTPDPDTNEFIEVTKAEQTDEGNLVTFWINLGGDHFCLDYYISNNTLFIYHEDVENNVMIRFNGHAFDELFTMILQYLLNSKDEIFKYFEEHNDGHTKNS